MNIEAPVIQQCSWSFRFLFVSAFVPMDVCEICAFAACTGCWTNPASQNHLAQLKTCDFFPPPQNYFREFLRFMPAVVKLQVLWTLTLHIFKSLLDKKRPPKRKNQTNWGVCCCFFANCYFVAYLQLYFSADIHSIFEIYIVCYISILPSFVYIFKRQVPFFFHLSDFLLTLFWIKSLHW